MFVKRFSIKVISQVLVVLLFASQVAGQVIVTVAGNGMGGYSGDGGPATNATMNQANDLAFDKDGNFYFSDDGVPRIRKVTPAGIITTVAGNGSSGYCCDGYPATLAQLKGGGGIAVDKWNNIYYADGSDHRVRKITVDGIIHTIAGTGVAGYNGDGIPATDAQLNIPEGIAVDDTGNVYIGDRLNYRIRKINTSGIITTIAGKGVAAFTPDGALADTSAIIGVSCLIVDNQGNVFLPDNNRIRKIVNGTGVLTTVAGNGTSGYSGDGGSATFASISTIKFTVDSVGNLYLSEGAPERIRKVSTDGTITTIAGTGAAGLENDGAPVLLARLHTPCGIAFRPAGELHYVDKSSARIRKITPKWDAASDMQLSGDALQLFPNPARDIVTITSRVQLTYTLTDVTGSVVTNGTIATGTQSIPVGYLPSGIYFITTTSPQGIRRVQKIVKE
jgi:hypothetical protein